MPQPHDNSNTPLKDRRYSVSKKAEAKRLRLIPTVVVGIDPGTGASSNTGFCAFLSQTREILSLGEIAPEGVSPGGAHHKRIKSIATILEYHMDALKEQYPEHIFVVCCEDFMIKGAANQLLQKLIGGIIARLPEGIELMMVHNTTVKRIAGGKGTVKKPELAVKVAEFFKENETSHGQILRAIETTAWDLTDAAAIGIAGFEMYQDL